MSRILRRPMFRGGPVDSRGTGITSGLMDDTGYADGGRVGFQGGGFNYLKDTGFGRSLPGIYEYGIKEPLAALYNIAGVPLNKASEFFTGYNPGFSGERFFNLKNRPSDKAEFFGIQTEAKPGMTYKDIDIAEREKYGTFGSETEDEIKDFENLYKKRKEVAAADKKDIEKVPDLLSDEDEMKKQTELYQKLLGGDEARAQAGYDALLAAAPAFFKGRNLREAAPQVLESINKSGAFDKPRDIKQAAAQLAIQRRILIDKAGAEARAKMAELGIKKPNTLTERYSFNFKQMGDSAKAAEFAVVDTYGEKYRPFAFNPATAKVGEVYKFPKDPKKPNAGFYYGEIKDLSDPKNIKINPLPL